MRQDAESPKSSELRREPLVTAFFENEHAVFSMSSPIPIPSNARSLTPCSILSPSPAQQARIRLMHS